MKIKVSIIDDKPELLEALSKNFKLFEEVEIVFTAQGGEEALKKLKEKEKQPNLILMDIEMPGMDGIRLTHKIREKYPEIKVIMLTVFDQDDKVFEAILAGACGYLLKDEKPTRIIRAIEAAMDGGAPMSPKIATKTLAFIRESSSKAAAATKTPEEFDLTGREIEILELLSNGFTYHEIADKLFISPKTVRKHIENIYHKLHIHTKVDAVKIGLRHNWF